MKIEIKHRFTGTIILEGEAESLVVFLRQYCEADLRGADLSEADLRGRCFKN